MTESLKPLEQDLVSLRVVWAGALPAFGTVGTAGASDIAREVASMSDAGLLSATDTLARLIRDGESMLAQVAGEVARRSPAHLGKDGLAKKQGFQNPAHLVAAATGGAVAAASRIVEVGKATAPRRSLTGAMLPARHPHVAAALTAGAISLDAAAAITGMLERVALRADPGQAEAMERILAERAGDLPLSLLMRMIREGEARLDQDGLAPREEIMRAERSLRMWEDSNGMLRLTGVLDPETGAPVKAAVESLVTGMIRTASRTPAGGGNPRINTAADEGSDQFSPVASVVVDDRTIVQLQADALAMIARHAAGCSRMPSVPAATMVVRTDLATLLDGIGQGTLDGLLQPVSAGTIRRMAATAGLIPVVLDGESLPLDLGTSRRLFSRAQRLALAERDGGCACCGLDIAYTEAHHITWWKRDHGPTDISNGVLLCPPCHTRIHTGGWSIQVRKRHIWFTPPPWVDPDQKPRLGGKARYALPLAS